MTNTMTNTTSGSGTTQTMSAILCSIFPALAEVPSAGRKAAAGKARNPAKPRSTPVSRSSLQQAIFQALQATALAAGMACLLLAYNLRDTIVAQASQAVMSVIG